MWMLISVYTGWFVADKATVTGIIGVCCNLNLIVFYASPLKTINYVIKTGDSSSIHRTTMVMSFANAFFWSLYGCAKMDPIIFVPNGAGSLLGMVQMSLCIWYPPSIPTARELEPLLVVKKIGDENPVVPLIVV